MIEDEFYVKEESKEVEDFLIRKENSTKFKLVSDETLEKRSSSLVTHVFDLRESMS